MFPEAWQTIFLHQLERLVSESALPLDGTTAGAAADDMLRMLLSDGEVTVEETRGRLVAFGHDYEPILSLIQLYSGAVQAICEEDYCREQEGLPSIFNSAPLTARWLLLEIVKAVTAVLVLSSRALDVQAALVLRHAWELVARSIVVASDPKLGARVDRWSTTAPSADERDALVRNWGRAAFSAHWLRSSATCPLTHLSRCRGAA